MANKVVSELKAVATKSENPTGSGMEKICVQLTAILKSIHSDGGRVENVNLCASEIEKGRVQFLVYARRGPEPVLGMGFDRVVLKFNKSKNK